MELYYTVQYSVLYFYEYEHYISHDLVNCDTVQVIVVTRRSAKSDLVRHTQRLKSVHLQMTPIPLSSSVASQSQSPLIAKRPIVETRSSGAGNGDVVGGSGNGNAAGGGGGGGGGDCDGGSNPRTPRTPTFGRERAQSDMPQLRPASSSYSPAAVSAIPRRSVLLRAPENGSSSAATDGSGNGNSRTSLMRRKSAGSTGPKRPDRSSTSESRKSAATTVALLSISFYYILTTLPVAACMVIAPYFPLGNKDMPLAAVPEDPEWRAFFAFRTVRNIIVDLAISHYALFFYVYLLTSPAFRRAALQVLARYVPCVFRRCYERERRRALLASTALNTGFGSTPTTFTTVGSSYSRPHSTLSSQ